MRCNLFIGIIVLSFILFTCASTKSVVENGEYEEKEEISGKDEVIVHEEPEDYTPSEAEYNRIFQEISGVIEKLNTIIRKKQYNLWLLYLTEDYKAAKGDKDFLMKLSEKPVIKNQGIILRSLKDYFFYVVVPSRYNVKVDKINFIDKYHIKAYTFINNEYIILYYLENDGDEWKIGDW